MWGTFPLERYTVGQFSMACFVPRTISLITFLPRTAAGSTCVTYILTVTFKVCCLFPVYSINRMESRVFVAISGYRALTLIQNLVRFEAASNIVLRPPLFAIKSSWVMGLTCWDFFFFWSSLLLCHHWVFPFFKIASPAYIVFTHFKESQVSPLVLDCNLSVSHPSLKGGANHWSLNDKDTKKKHKMLMFSWIKLVLFLGYTILLQTKSILNYIFFPKTRLAFNSNICLSFFFRNGISWILPRDSKTTRITCNIVC